MTPLQLSALLNDLLDRAGETEWIEFKRDYTSDHIGRYLAEYLSALANSAALHSMDCAYMVWGIEDGTKSVVGTSFKPRLAKQGNEELNNWLMRSLQPQVDFKIHEWKHEGKSVVLFEIPKATRAPIRVGSEEFIRVGTLKKKLKDYQGKEAELWASFSRSPFESDLAKSDLAGGEVLALIDFDKCFELLQVVLPTDQRGILSRLVDEKLLIAKPGRRFDVTNLGSDAAECGSRYTFGVTSGTTSSMSRFLLTTSF